MSISIRWDESNESLIHAVFQGDWTLQEFNIAAQAVEQMMNAVDRTVHTVINMEDAAPPENVIRRFPSFNNGSHFAHKNAGKLIYVGLSEAEETLSTVLPLLFRYESDEVIFVTTMHEARTLIKDKQQYQDKGVAKAG